MLPLLTFLDSQQKARRCLGHVPGMPGWKSTQRALQNTVLVVEGARGVLEMLLPMISRKSGSGREVSSPKSLKGQERNWKMQSCGIKLLIGNKMREQERVCICSTGRQWQRTQNWSPEEVFSLGFRKSLSTRFYRPSYLLLWIHRDNWSFFRKKPNRRPAGVNADKQLLPPNSSSQWKR